jgi:ComEC/Rec2-related protein
MYSLCILLKPFFFAATLYAFSFFKRDVGFLLLALGAGISVHALSPLYILCFFFLSSGCAIFMGIKKWKPLLVFSALFLFGIALPKIILFDQAKLLKKVANKPNSFTALVTKKQPYPIPRHKELLSLHIYKGTKTNTIPHPFTITCYLQEKTPLLVGDTIYINNVTIPRPSSKTTISKKGSFEFFLMKEQILASLFTKELDYKLLNRPAFSLRRFFSSTKEAICKKLREKLSRKTSDLFSSVFLGNTKNNLTLEKERSSFSFWGLAHYLARSGLHIALFVFVWKLFLSFLPVAIFFRRAALCLLCLIYFALSWPSISFLRALGLFLSVESGSILLRQTNALHLLCSVALVILLFNPFQLFFLDFQLSFCLAGALAFTFQARKGPQGPSE